MYEVGYNDTKTFRDVFRRITGISSVAYRNKYNRAEGYWYFVLIIYKRSNQYLTDWSVYRLQAKN